MFINQIIKFSKYQFIAIFVMSVSACSTSSHTPHKNEFSYAYHCTEQGQAITRFITAKVPLTLEEIQSLKPTLEENFQLDYGSCKYIDAK